MLPAHQKMDTLPPCAAGTRYRELWHMQFPSPLDVNHRVRSSLKKVVSGECLWQRLQACAAVAASRAGEAGAHPLILLECV